MGVESEDDDDEPHTVRYNLHFSLSLSSIDIIQAFLNVTIPPIIKTVVCNGHTLVYCTVMPVQNADMDHEIPSMAEPQSQLILASRNLIQCAASYQTSYPSMVSCQLEPDIMNSKYLFIHMLQVLFIGLVLLTPGNAGSGAGAIAGKR